MHHLILVLEAILVLVGLVFIKRAVFRRGPKQSLADLLQSPKNEQNRSAAEPSSPAESIRDLVEQKEEPPRG
jgi:flagellar biosynthesis/type III secretory pathway M-ring protein FliF/YscJ